MFFTCYVNVEISETIMEMSVSHAILHFGNFYFNLKNSCSTEYEFAVPQFVLAYKFFARHNWKSICSHRLKKADADFVCIKIFLSSVLTHNSRQLQEFFSILNDRYEYRGTLYNVSRYLTHLTINWHLKPSTRSLNVDKSCDWGTSIFSSAAFHFKKCQVWKYGTLNNDWR